MNGDAPDAQRADVAEPDGEERDEPALVAAIRAAADAAGGRLTFARFMDLALYHPTHGYYQSQAARPGRGGDFLTSPELSPFFGWCLMRQIRQIWEGAGRPDPFTVLEYGAGGGRLAHDILLAARSESPQLADCLHYRLHESNPHRRSDARALLDGAGFAGRVAFEEPSQTAREAPPFVGVVLTNEFVDALPVHRVVGGEGGAILERYVRWEAANERFVDELDRPSTPQLVGSLAAGGVALAVGQEAEINLAAGAWLATVAARLTRGVVLTIDYGYPTTELYAPRRRAGTFLCYHRHTANDEPYARIGRQDMTAHVDFGALTREGGRQGLATLGLTTQGPFLSNVGLGDLLVTAQTPGRALDAYLADRSAVLALIEPGGMGRFGVLAQGKGYIPAPLHGFGPLT